MSLPRHRISKHTSKRSKDLSSRKTPPPPRWSPKQVYAFAVAFASIVFAVGTLFDGPWSVARLAVDRGERVPGVAFHLAPEYAVAAVYGDDGVAVNVARIDGSPSYRSVMHNASFDQYRSRPQTYFCDAVATVKRELFQLDIRTPDFCLSEGELAVRRMVEELKSKVESHLGTRFCFAALVVDDYWGERRYTAVTARQDAGLGNVEVLNGPGRSFRPAGRSCVIRETTSGPSLPYVVEHQTTSVKGAPVPADINFLLAVQYAGTYFNTAAFHLSREEARGVWAADSPNSGIRFFADASSTLSALQTHLNDLLTYHSRYEPQKINKLSLSGSLARDPAFRAVLTEVLGPHLVASAYVDDDAFTAARGMAAQAFEAMQTPAHARKMERWIRFSCMCSSKLYATRWWDLLDGAWWSLRELLGELVQVRRNVALFKQGVRDARVYYQRELEWWMRDFRRWIGDVRRRFGWEESSGTPPRRGIDDRGS